MKYVERVRHCQPGWKEKVDNFLDIVMPCRCVACGLAAPASGLCIGCFAGLPLCRQACHRCGLPLTRDETVECGGCQRQPPAWNSVFAATWYVFPIRELVQGFKFRRNMAMGRALGHVMSQRLADTSVVRPDLLVPVPLHAWRLARRGFNQAFSLARILARDFGLELCDYDLRRQRRTCQQAGLSASERRRNLSRAFSWHGKDLAGRRVALVDDVMTTGSTALECTLTLTAAGASKVDIWALARAPRPF